MSSEKKIAFMANGRLRESKYIIDIDVGVGHLEIRAEDNSSRDKLCAMMIALERGMPEGLILERDLPDIEVDIGTGWAKMKGSTRGRELLIDMLHGFTEEKNWKEKGHDNEGSDQNAGGHDPSREEADSSGTPYTRRCGSSGDV